MDDLNKDIKRQIREFKLGHYGDNYVGISEYGDLATLDGRFSPSDLREISGFLDQIKLHNSQLKPTDSD